MSSWCERSSAAAAVCAASRILVVGCPGTGKSTLARALARHTGLPLWHMDDLYWREGWTRPSDAELTRDLATVLAHRRGIIDGNYARFLPQRCAWAEAVVYLDLPTLSAVRGLLARRWRRLRGDTASLPRRVREGGSRGGEPLSPGFVWLVLSFRWRVRPQLLRALAPFDDGRLLVLRSRRQVRAFMDDDLSGA